MRTAKQLIETFDTIGNRTQTEAGGDQNGANLRVANYTNNTLNQITSRDVPGYVDVMGDALATNSVTVNGQTAYRKNEYYRQQLSVANTSAAVWQSVTNASPEEGRRVSRKAEGSVLVFCCFGASLKGRWGQP